MKSANWFSHLNVFLFSIAALYSLTGSSLLAKELPISVQMFYIGFDALEDANERPEGISTEENVERVKILLQKVVVSGARINRTELNNIYPGLGDNFLDGAVKHAQLMIKVINSRNDDLMNRAMGAYITWQTWWKKNKKNVTELLINRFG